MHLTGFGNTLVQPKRSADAVVRFGSPDQVTSELGECLSKCGTVFVNTSAWYVAADIADVHHAWAKSRFEVLSGDLLTSDYILIE